MTEQAVLDAAVRDNNIHGGVVLAGTRGGEILSCVSGFADAAHRFPMLRNTVIDIASCTKVTATVTGLLVAHSRGLIDFDAPFSEYLPEYTGKTDCPISVRALANHLSEFYHAPDEWPRCYFDESGRTMLQKVLRLSPPFPPPETPQYACWNNILLAKILEHVTATPFDRFCETAIFLLSAWQTAPSVLRAGEFRNPVWRKQSERKEPDRFPILWRLGFFAMGRRRGMPGCFPPRKIWRNC